MKKWLRITLISLACLVVLAGAGFFLYVSDYYRADDAAVAAITGRAMETRGNLTILTPSVPSDTGLIFYPGGKVEHTAYLPLLERLRQQGITCVLVEMPFHLAVFDPAAADKVFDALPEVENWYIGGHSLGGAMASDYASQHPDKVQGLVLLGAYLYGSFPAQRVLTLYGSEDGVMDRSKLTDTGRIVEIVGGNHAQFGNYGVQKGDGVAGITAGEQQSQAAASIISFMKAGEHT